MTNPRQPWFDDEAGPLIRPYTMTGGRTGTPRELDLITLVVASRWDFDLSRLGSEHGDIIRMCARPLSVAEVSAGLSFPLAVTKILIGDLIDGGYLTSRAPSVADISSQGPDLSLLQAVLDGIRKL